MKYILKLKKILILLLALIMTISMTQLSFYSNSVAFAEETSSIEVKANDGVFTFDNSKDAAVCQYIEIGKDGTYTITGTAANGYIEVKKKAKNVTLILDNLNLTVPASSGMLEDSYSPLMIKDYNADEIANEGKEARTVPVKVILKTGTTNYLTDNRTGEIKPKAVVNASSDITIEAEPRGDQPLETYTPGKLVITSKNKNGIKSDGILTINSGDITVDTTAADHGIAADKHLIVNGGTIKVNSKGDGLRSKPDAEDVQYFANKDAGGNVTINGGTIEINSIGEGIEGTHIKINQVTPLIPTIITITSEDDGINASTDCPRELQYAYLSEQAGEPLSINVTGGKVTVVSKQDGFDSNNLINISGGDIAIFAGSVDRSSNALDSDGLCTITGGTILGTNLAFAMPTRYYIPIQKYISKNVSYQKGAEISIDDNGNIVKYTALSEVGYVFYTSSTLSQSDIDSNDGNMGDFGIRHRDERTGSFGGGGGGGLPVKAAANIDITATNGTVTLSSRDVKVGEDVTLTVIPSEGYEISDLIVDGISLGPVSTYTLKAVKSSVKVEAKFLEIKKEKTKDELIREAKDTLLKSTKDISFKSKTAKAKAKKGKTGIKISWKSIENVDGYEVYRSTSKSKGYVKVFETEKTSYTNTKKLKSGNRYYYKVRAYILVDDSKVYSDWSTKASRIA